MPTGFRGVSSGTAAGVALVLSADEGFVGELEDLVTKGSLDRVLVEEGDEVVDLLGRQELAMVALVTGL